MSLENLRYRITETNDPRVLSNQLNKILSRVATDIVTASKSGGTVAAAAQSVQIREVVTGGLSQPPPSVVAPFLAINHIWGKPIPPASAAGVMIRIPFAVTVVLPAGLTNTQFVAGVAATADTVFTIFKNAASIGSITYPAGQLTATYSFPTDISFGIADILTVVAPNVADATLSDLGYMIIGARQ